MKINTYIEIVRTSNSRFSSMSAKSAERIRQALSQYYTHVSVSVVNDILDLEGLVRKRPDLVFLGLKRLPHGSTAFGESSKDIWLAEYLDDHNITYTGAVADAMKLDFNKEAAKARVRQAGLPTAASFISVIGQHLPGGLPLSFPLFVKPIGGGGSRGIGDDSVVRTFAQFQSKVRSIYQNLGSSALVEQYLDGREFSVAILDNNLAEPITMPIEIITPRNFRGDRILSSAVKHEDHEQVIPVQDESIRESVCNLAVAAYKVLGGRDMGRIDIRMDESGKAHFLEANFMPAPGSRYFAGAFEINIGMAYPGLLFTITELSLLRAEPARLSKEQFSVSSYV